MARTPRSVFRRQSDAVYDELRRLIIRTELDPGAPIEEAALMKRLGVGRTPLREALQRLAQEDLIRNVPRRGYFVTETSAADLLQVFEVRQSLEKLSARLAAERAGPAHLAEYERMLGEARLGVTGGNEDMDWNLAIDEWFHQLLARASGNAYLVGAINRYYALSVRVHYLSRLHLTMVREEIEKYEAMGSALSRRDGAAAAAVMHEHLSFDPMAFMHLSRQPLDPAPGPMAAIQRPARRPRVAVRNAAGRRRSARA
jgi:GntR family transcriptional regulator, rspAB operon transcriptional repressor